MNLRPLFLTLLFANFSTLLAVTEIAPDPTNKGNWNSEELLAHLKRSWEIEDMAVMREWFYAKDDWKPIWVKITFWRQPDSEFKRKVAIMMLRSAPDAWQDPITTQSGESYDVGRSEERESTIEGCLETIRQAAPNLPVRRTDFATTHERIALADRFEAAMGFNKPRQPASDETTHAETDLAQLPADPSKSKPRDISIKWLIATVAILAAAWAGRKVFRKGV